MSGSRRKALRKGKVLLAGVRPRTLRGVNWDHEPKEPTIRPSKPTPRVRGEPKPGSRKAKLAEKRALGPQTPTDEAKKAAQAFFFQRLVDEHKRQALAAVRKRRKEDGKPAERKNRRVFEAGR